MKAISSAESSCPSRFRRMISWGSMDPTLLETAALLPGALGDRDPDLAQLGQRFLGIRVVAPGEEAEAQHGEGGDTRDVGGGGAGVGFSDLGLDLALGRRVVAELPHDLLAARLVDQLLVLGVE